MAFVSPSLLNTPQLRIVLFCLFDILYTTFVRILYVLLFHWSSESFIWCFLLVLSTGYSCIGILNLPYNFFLFYQRF